jgi:hypothetical protein
MLALKQMITPLTQPQTAQSGSMFDGENVALHSSGSAPTMAARLFDGENVALHSSGSAPTMSTAIKFGDLTGLYSSGS